MDLTPTTHRFITRKLPNDSVNPDDPDGPSWGLIIPIIMIVLFLTGVGLCLWWHKWRDKRTLHIQRDSTMSSAFQRSYRGRSRRNGFDAVRDSTRSTIPLRSSLNEKIANNNNNMVKVNNVNVIPVHTPRYGSGKYAFHWDKNHWRGYPAVTPVHQALSASGSRKATKPLSPIDEIDSPGSIKISELSQNYDINAQASFSPYHITWTTPSSKPGVHELPISNNGPQRLSYRSHLSSAGDSGHTPLHGYQTVVNSPFFPNNNTPTTECDTGSEASHMQYLRNGGSQVTSYPFSPKSTVRSESNLGLSLSSETDATHRTSYTTSYSQG